MHIAGNLNNLPLLVSPKLLMNVLCERARGSERARRAYSMLAEWTSIFANNPYICSNYDPFSCGQCLYAIMLTSMPWPGHTHTSTHLPFEARALIKHRRTEISCFWSISNQLIMVIFPGNVNKYFVASYIEEWEWEGQWEWECMAPERRAIYIGGIWNVWVQVEQSKLLTNDVYPLLVAVCTWCILHCIVRRCPW